MVSKREKDDAMSTWTDRDYDEVRHLARSNFWWGVLFGAPIWIFLTVCTIMFTAVTLGF